MATRTVGVPLVGLVAAATLLFVGGVGYRLGGAATATKVVVPDMRAAPMHAVVLQAEIAPRAAPDSMPEGRLREFEEAFAKAWHAGLQNPSESETENERSRAAATTVATGETRSAIASATANADPPTTTTTGTASAIARTTTPTEAGTPDPPAATVTASADRPATVPTATNAPATPTASANAPPANATPPAVFAVTSPTPTIVGDAGPSDLHVIVYTAYWCDVCKQAEAWMVHRQIPYEERDITAFLEYAQALRLISPSLEIPTFDIDGDVLVGFNPRQLIMMVKRAALKRAGGAAR